MTNVLNVINEVIKVMTQKRRSIRIRKLKKTDFRFSDFYRVIVLAKLISLVNLNNSAVYEIFKYSIK